MAKFVQEKGINDTSHGWRNNKINKLIYRKWYSMLERVYSENLHKKSPTYINSTICLEWHWLSKFAEDFKNIDGYNEEKFLNGELVLDKDIKSNGKNKEYSLENCMLVSNEENIKQANSTREYGESPFKGKKQTYETKQKISESKKGHIVSEETKMKRKETLSKNGALKGKNNPNSKGLIARIDKNTLEILEIKYGFEYVEQEYKKSLYACCNGKQKSSDGFYWKWINEEEHK